MNKKLLLVLVLSLVLTLAGCSGVDQEELDALTAEKDALQGEVDTLTADKVVLEGEVDTLTTDKVALEGEKTALQTELDGKMVGYTDQSVEAYGFTHGGYVGQVTIVVTDGVLDVEMNEAFLPHTLAEVDLSTVENPTDWDETNTLTIGSKSYVLYIMYNDAMFKATVTDAGVLVYSEVDETGAFKTSRGDVTNLEMTILKNDTNMKEYYDVLTDGGFKLLKSMGDTTPIVVSEGQFKDGNPNYWPAGGDRLGWQVNIDALEAFLEENGAAYDTLAFTTVTATVNGVEDNYWQIVDTIAGATNSDFQDYFQLAQSAFGQLETEVK